jgi:hypothetical protein
VKKTKKVERKESQADPLFYFKAEIVKENAVKLLQLNSNIVMPEFDFKGLEDDNEDIFFASEHSFIEDDDDDDYL